MKTVLIFLLALLSSCGYTFAQTVDRTGDKNYMGQATIGTDTTAYLATPSSAWLQVGRDSTTKGMLPARVVDTSDVTDPTLGNTVFQIEDSTYYVYKGTWQKIGGSISLAAYMKKSDSTTLFVTPTRQADSTAAIRNDMVKASGSQTISGTKTFTSTTQFVNGSGSTVRFIRTLASGGDPNVHAVELDFEPATPTAGIGAAFWLRAYDTTKNLVSVGTIGGRLMNIDTGEAAGEIHLSPAWQGSDPDTNTAGLSVLATGSDSADTYIYGGSLFLAIPPESGSSSDSLLLRDSHGRVRQISANSLLQVLNEDTVTTISALTSYTGAAHILVVTDTLQGGVFYKSGQTLTNDNGVVFSASGGGHWARLYNNAHGVNVDWWGARNQTTVNKAIAYAGDGGIVNFTPKKVYTLTGSIGPMDGQTLQGNGAVLFRAADSVVHLTQDAQVGDSFIVVNAIPSAWLNGGLVQLFTDSTNYGCVSGGQYIDEIDGDTVWLGTTVPANAATNWNHPTRTYWPADTTKVHHVFDMIENSQGINFKVVDLTFDGNRANNDANHSWTINASVALRGDGAQSAIEDCRFEDIPNENIVGQGFHIRNNTADSLSGSFVHLSADFSESPSPVPSFINGNAVTNSNLIDDSVGGHSEGAITCSLTPGYVNIENNRFKNGSNAFIGVIANSVGATNGAFRNVVVTGNYAENFHLIFYSLSPISTTFSKAGHIIVSGNIFNNCDTTDWTSSQSNIDAYFDTITVGENQLVGGTVWDIPMQESDASQRYILNNASSTAQGASINISGSATLSNLKSATSLATDADGKIIAGTAPVFGSASFAGDGTTSTFTVTISTGLPSQILITPTDAAAAQALFFISARSATSFSVTVPTNGTIPPDTGTQNVTFDYELIY